MNVELSALFDLKLSGNTYRACCSRRSLNRRTKTYPRDPYCFDQNFIWSDFYLSPISSPIIGKYDTLSVPEVLLCLEGPWKNALFESSNDARGNEALHQAVLFFCLRPSTK